VFSTTWSSAASVPVAATVRGRLPATAVTSVTGFGSSAGEGAVARAPSSLHPHASAVSSNSGRTARTTHGTPPLEHDRRSEATRAQTLRTGG
jgi:hypothetical protein